MGYKPCWHGTACEKLAVIASKSNQVVQIRIQVSDVGAVSTLVEFACRPETEVFWEQNWIKLQHHTMGPFFTNAVKL